MPDMNITTLSITGYAGHAVPNRFFRQDGRAHTLAVLFPGLRYSCDMPLLYYPFKLLFGGGADVLQVRSDYTLTSYQSLPVGERAAWLAADAQAAMQAARVQGEYSRLVLIGKSIGTVALASLVPHEPEAITIWLTPLLRNPHLIAPAEQNRGAALFIAGTADDLYHASALEQIRSASGAQVELIEAGNHSLEIEGDFFASLRALEQVMRSIARFLDQQGI